MSDERRERRAAKLGRLRLERDEIAGAEAQRFVDRQGASQPALFELASAAPALPDDDKPAGPGRPVGARATAPAEYRRYILSTKGDFVGRFAGLAQVDVFALAKALGCTPLEAIRLQLDMGKMAAPYVYAQQPRALEEEDRDYFAGLVFLAGSAVAQSGAAHLKDQLAALAGRPPTMQEIQAVEPVEFVASEPAHSEPPAADEEKAP